MRADVLGGRGPGAPLTEVLQHTRARTEIGGEPVTALRQALADDTARARRDPEQLALVVAADRSRLTATVTTLREGVAAPAGPGVARRRRPAVLRLLGRVLAGRWSPAAR
jgi:hypothetical protein